MYDTVYKGKWEKVILVLYGLYSLLKASWKIPIPPSKLELNVWLSRAFI